VSKNHEKVLPSKSAKIRFKYILASNFSPNISSNQFQTQMKIYWQLEKYFAYSMNYKDFIIFEQNFKVSAIVIMGPKPI